MTNREKFAEKILDIACNGNWMAVNKATLEPIKCQELPCKDCLFCVLDKPCNSSCRYSSTCIHSASKTEE